MDGEVLPRPLLIQERLELADELLLAMDLVRIWQKSLVQ